jgi:hypothetical protein
VLRERPCHVLAYHGVAVLAARFERGEYFRCGRRVAQRHREVAQPALVAAAPDRRPFGALQELRLAPCEQLCQRGPVEVVAGAEIGFVGFLRELVPGAYQLAVVAAEDAVADQGPQFLVDRALVLNGEIADAAARVEPVGGGDGTRRANVDTAAAGAAVRARRRVDR